VKARDIEERTFAFALAVVKLCRQFDKNPGTSRALASQLLKAGTSVGANVQEAQAGQSRADFISKYSIALKEAREAGYWLRLMAESESAGPTETGPLLKEAEELALILGAIVSRSKRGSGS
jgi:four helix bundle protein